MSELKRTRLILLALFSLLFVGVYGSSDFLARLVPYRISMGEATWPYFPELASLYLSLNLLFLVAFFKVSERSLFRFFTSLSLQTLAAWPIFLLCPLEQLPLAEVPQSFSYQLADTINLSNNYFPSLHVCYAITCAYFFRHPFIILWSLGISASTVLIHQHYPIDALGGVAMALFFSCWVNKHGGRILAACLSDLLRCVSRHRRYLVIACGLLFYRVLRPGRGRTALLGFCYLQRLDDLLDGHLATEQEPETIALEQIQAWQKGVFAQDELSELGAALYEMPVSKDNVVSVIQEMILDRQRIRDKRLLTEAELDEHLQTTFQLSLDLMLEASGATVRSEDVPSLSKLLGWCSVVRDLEEDLAFGLINLPVENLESGRLTEWFEERHRMAAKLYEGVASELESVRGEKGYVLLRLFHESVKKYLDRPPSSLSRDFQSFLLVGGERRSL